MSRRVDGTSDLMMVPFEVCELGAPLGLGVVARRWIEAGTLIAVFGGTAMRGAHFHRLPAARRSLSIQVADDVFLVPEGEASPAALINHSCEPSCRLQGEITLVAARDIAPGEALTYDYATSDGSPYDEFDCLCGTASCRRRITGVDWSRADLQARYAGWFSPYLQARIDDMCAAERDPSGDLIRL